MINTHRGVLFEKARAFGTDFVVHLIDMEEVQIKIVTGFNRVDTAVLAHGANLGFNNVGWGRHKRGPGVPNDLLWIEGRAVQNSPIDYRRFYSVNILKDGEVRFDWILRNQWNVIGFDRIIAKAGIFNRLVTDVSRAPRTVYAKDISGRLMILTCEGRAVDQLGLTFKECWEILQGYAATDAGNADGGYSTCAMNTAVSRETLIQSYKKEYRLTVSQTLFFADPLTSVPASTPIGRLLENDASRLNDPILRGHVHQLREKHPTIFEEAA